MPNKKLIALGVLALALVYTLFLSHSLRSEIEEEKRINQRYYTLGREYLYFQQATLKNILKHTLLKRANIQQEKTKEGLKVTVYKKNSPSAAMDVFVQKVFNNPFEVRYFYADADKVTVILR